MPTLHLLGTGAALAPPDRTTTMLAVESDSVIVVDCGGDVVQRLLAAGIALDAIRVLVVTHEHPDHVSGFPLFMEKIWLSGRRTAIPVVGPRPALEQARRVFEAFDTSGWKGMPPIDWREVPLVENATAWRDDEWLITSSPGEHSVPVIGLRIKDVKGAGTVTYSADTERAAAIVRLARGSDILVHEATGDFPGHATPVDAAEAAREAGVGRLILVHIPADADPDGLRSARDVFPDTELGRDGGRYDF
jgi:ribonuclease Z